MHNLYHNYNQSVYSWYHLILTKPYNIDITDHISIGQKS